jgi:hypothetical protein
MPTMPYKEGGDFPELPERTPLNCRVIESEYETQANPFYGKADAKGKVDEREERDVVKIVLEVEDDDYTGSRIWKTFTASISEKAAIVPFIHACYDRDLTLDELKAFDSDDLVGQQVMVTGEYKPGDTERKFLRPTGFMRVGKAAKTAAKAKSEPKAAKPATAKPAAAAAPKPSAREAAIAKMKAELAALEGPEPEPEPENAAGVPVDPDEDFDPDEIPF